MGQGASPKKQVIQPSLETGCPVSGYWIWNMERWNVEREA